MVDSMHISSGRSQPIARRRHAVLDTVLIEGVLLHNSGLATSTHRERMGKMYQLRRSGDLWTRAAATGAWTRCVCCDTQGVAPLASLPCRAGFQVGNAAFFFPDVLGRVERDAWVDALRTAQSAARAPTARHARPQLKRFTSREPGYEVVLLEEKQSLAQCGSHKQIFGDLQVEPDALLSLPLEETTHANDLGKEAKARSPKWRETKTRARVTRTDAKKNVASEAQAVPCSNAGTDVGNCEVEVERPPREVEIEGTSALDDETRVAVDALLHTVSQMRELTSGAAEAAERMRANLSTRRSRADACDFEPRAGEELRALINAHWLSRGDIEELAGCRTLDIASLCTLLAPDTGACLPSHMVTRRAFAGAMLESVSEGGGGSGSAWCHARGLSIALIDALFSALASPFSGQGSAHHSPRAGDGSPDTVAAQPLVGSACVDLSDTARFEHLIAGLALLCGSDDDALAHALFAVGDVGLVPHEDVVAPRRWRCGLVSRATLRRFFGTAYVELALPNSSAAAPHSNHLTSMNSHWNSCESFLSRAHSPNL